MFKSHKLKTIFLDSCMTWDEAFDYAQSKKMRLPTYNELHNIIATTTHSKTDHYMWSAVEGMALSIDGRGGIVNCVEGSKTQHRVVIVK
jgi:hypothetical protein